MKRNTDLFKFLAALLFLLPVMQSCQEDEELVANKNAKNSDVPTVGAGFELTLDSLFLYAKETYLWNEALPGYGAFNPRSYNTSREELSNLQEELFDISQYQVNPATGKPYEFISYSENYPKYSYIIEAEGGFSGNQGARIARAEETNYDFGFALTAVAGNDIRLRYVNPNSPAANAGLKRGEKLLKINGRTVRADSQSDVDYINNSMENATITVTVQKANSTTAEVKLNQTSYLINPVMKYQVIERGSKKVGYLVYDSFTRLSNSRTELDEAFSTFASEGVTDLIIDLRYNGGGYVNTAEYLINLIAPSRLNGAVMYTEKYNEMMQNGEATILENQLLLDENDQPQKYNGRNATYADLDFTEEGNTFEFSKKGSLENIQNVCFIVGEGTASASELVINSLKPYLNVTLVGQQTYGKPVGFFGINIDRYTVFMPNFQTINSKGEGEYFDGFAPDIKVNDDVTHDFGDPEEDNLEVALQFLAPGNLQPNSRMSTQSNSRISGSSPEVFLKIGGDKGFKGMVENRRNLPN